MKNEWERYFLVATVIVTAGIGGAFLFAPHAIPGIFSEDYVEPSARFYLQFLGAAMFGYSVLNALALNYIADKRLREIACKANITSLGIALIVTVNGLAIGVLSNLAWIFILEHAIFLTGFIIIIRTNRQ